MWVDAEARDTDREGLVAKKVDIIIISLHKLQTVRLVPAYREDIKADLAANRVRQVVVSKLLLQHLYHLGPEWGTSGGREGGGLSWIDD